MIENDKREKAIQTIKYLRGDAVDYGLENKFMQEVVETFDAAILALQQKPNKWILVSERLPEIADTYRVTRYFPNNDPSNVMNHEYVVDVCGFDGAIWYTDGTVFGQRAYINNVVAWLENPEPYKPQESE